MATACSGIPFSGAVGESVSTVIRRLVQIMWPVARSNHMKADVYTYLQQDDIISALQGSAPYPEPKQQVLSFFA